MKKVILQGLMLLTNSGARRADLVRKYGGFHHYGKGGSYRPIMLPSEPYLVSIGNNVAIAANVRFITHDVINAMINNRVGGENTIKYPFHMDKIIIKDNVVIGADTTILYGVTIESNSIVAAGSVVVKDVPEGTIVPGCPAKVIGDIQSLIEKRSKEDSSRPSNNSDMREIEDYFWKE